MNMVDNPILFSLPSMAWSYFFIIGFAKYNLFPLILILLFIIFIIIFMFAIDYKNPFCIQYRFI